MRFTSSTARVRWRRRNAIAAGDERPFAGVPLRSRTCRPPPRGCASRAARISTASTRRTTTRSRAAHTPRGFVIVGKTAAPELGIVPVTEPRRFGPTRNPWDTERTPGGSSAARPRPSPAGSCDRNTPPTAAARYGSRPRAAGLLA